MAINLLLIKAYKPTLTLAKALTRVNSFTSNGLISLSQVSEKGKCQKYSIAWKVGFASHKSSFKICSLLDCSSVCVSGQIPPFMHHRQRL